MIKPMSFRKGIRFLSIRWAVFTLCLASVALPTNPIFAQQHVDKEGLIKEQAIKGDVADDALTKDEQSALLPCEGQSQHCPSQPGPIGEGSERFAAAMAAAVHSAETLDWYQQSQLSPQQSADVRCGCNGRYIDPPIQAPEADLEPNFAPLRLFSDQVDFTDANTATCAEVTLSPRRRTMSPLLISKS